ncbi:hypothetical protein ACIPK7_04720 [Pseudomonas sp. NPDC086581]|uniref:hypothetical protein n=1 Tax=Pseudomonas sp. NPDC086581 TaxID=3364432 RepID=UPI00381F6FFB
MKWPALYLCLMSALACADQAQVRIEEHLQPADSVLVGATLRLQVDVLVDSWFRAAPQLPELNLDGATVTMPEQAEQNLSVVRDGTPFFGLRYSYLISPRRAGVFGTPALTVQVQPGQSSGRVSVRLPTLTFTAHQPAGAASGAPTLVAEALNVTQRVLRSADPLAVGGRITREVVVEATGAQAEAMPPIVFASVDGLRTYPLPARVESLHDGRGGFIGARRVASVDYLIERSGHFTLPPIELHWWDMTGQRQAASVSGVEVSARQAQALPSPFALVDEQALPRWLGRHCLMIGALVGMAATLYVLIRTWGSTLGRRWSHRWSARKARRLASAEYAWRLALRHLAMRPARLDGLYGWARKSTGSLELRQQLAGCAAHEQALDHYFRARFAAMASADAQLRSLARLLGKAGPQKRRTAGPAGPGGAGALRPLRVLTG